MGTEKKFLINQFNKYIRKVIVPTYPQIIDFKVVDWLPNNDLAFEFDFYFVEQPQSSLEIQVEDAVREMMDVFSIETIVYGINFKIKE